MRIMIVDDEDLIRESLVKFPAWETMGCVIAGAAGNGQEALAQIPACKPDLIITDIRMPVMDGLELAGRVRQLYPSIALIFVTAFGDFSYARQAIKLGVSDFITKPIQAEEVILAVDLIQQGIRHMSGEQRMRQEKCLESLFSGGKLHADDGGCAELAGRQLMLMQIEVDNIEFLHQTGNSISMLALRETVCSLLKYQPFPYWTYLDHKGIYVLLITRETEVQEFKDAAIRAARDILEGVKNAFEYTVSVGISEVLSSPSELREAKENIKECMDYRMLLGKSSIVSSDVIGILERTKN